MIEYSKLNIEDIEKLKTIIREDHPAELLEFKINPEFKKVFLYPTNDVYLYEEQFNALLNVIGEIAEDGNINIIQAGHYRIYKPGNTVCTLCVPFDFNEYLSINLDSITLIYPDSCSWVLISDEELYFGWGIFCSSDDIIEKFKRYYPTYKNDIVKYKQAHERRPKLVETMLEFLN